MTFSEMASMTGGGVQTPGFMGHGKHYIASHKFLKAEGGVGRLVWLPKELKDQIRDKLNETAKDMYDIDNFAGSRMQLHTGAVRVWVNQKPPDSVWNRRFLDGWDQTFSLTFAALPRRSRR